MPHVLRADDCDTPLIIGHRGASGYRPEHTLASYKLAIELGADFIEPDLVSTKDGVLVARHENEISGTTDVASHPEFAERKATKVIDDFEISGWFTEDFTLAELKTLRARERLPDLRPDNTTYDNQFPIPTLNEVIRLAQVESRVQRRTIGIYPETKHPSYFASIGLAFEESLVRTLHRHGYRGPRAPVFIQSFETGNLKQLKRMTRLRLVQLIDATGAAYDLKAAGDARSSVDLVTAEGLAEVATYADGVGVDKNLVIPRNAEAVLQAPTSLVEDAHAAGVIVHAWTFRAENNFLPADFRVGNPTDAGYRSARGDLGAELARFFALGLDGVFTDFPDAGVAARTKLQR
jgi:glycerophosphoryl diester phosphodiesterase